MNRFADGEPYIFDFTYTVQGERLVATGTQRSDGTWTRYTWDDKAFTTAVPDSGGALGNNLVWSFYTDGQVADRQDDIFTTEEATAGYGVFQLDASYMLARRHVMHIFGVNAFNLGDRLYRNHLSFIKSFAPEIGRGVKFYYTMQLF